MSNKKTVLYIGPYEQTDNWGRASRSYIKAIASNPDITLKIHPIKYAQTNRELVENDIFETLEKTTVDNYDYVIQHALPGDFFYDGNYKKNIALTLIEPNDWTSSYDSISNLNSMDEIWVQTNFEKQNLLKSGVTSKIKNIGYPIDVDIIKDTTESLMMPKAIKNHFKFYYIGSYEEKQNIKNIVTAFHMAFDYEDDVSLVLKIDDPRPDMRQQIDQDIKNIKNSTGLSKKIKSELVISESLNHHQIVQLHNACDCYISVPYYESYCENILTSIILNKRLLVNKNTSASDFISEDNGLLVKSHKRPIMLKNKSISNDHDFYTAEQYAFAIDVYDLKNKMIEVYEGRNDTDTQTNRDINKYSYAGIGQKIWE